MSLHVTQTKSLIADAEANWKEKIQLYVEQVVFNSHFSVLPCIPVDAS